jgi:hypothetical protein
MGLNGDVRDLSGGDCDALNSDKCVCLLSPTSDNYWIELGLHTYYQWNQMWEIYTCINYHP